MTSITFSDLITIIFVIVDDWYQVYGQKYVQGKVGRKPVLSDREIMTLMLVQEFLPFPISGYKRSKRQSDFLGSANYGFCASQNLKYFGYKLVMASTLKGLPVVYDLVPANLDERLAAEALIDQFSFCDIFADKDFIGFEWQSQVFDQTGNLIWTPKRANQYQQNSKRLDPWLSAVRERIEGLFHELQNTGRISNVYWQKRFLAFVPA